MKIIQPGVDDPGQPAWNGYAGLPSPQVIYSERVGSILK